MKAPRLLQASRSNVSRTSSLLFLAPVCVYIEPSSCFLVQHESAVITQALENSPVESLVLYCEQAVHRVHVDKLHARRQRPPLLYRVEVRARKISPVHVVASYDVFLQAGCAMCTIGRRCARLYSSWNWGSASDRITLPIDMKKLLMNVSAYSETVSYIASYPNVAPDAPIY